MSFVLKLILSSFVFLPVAFPAEFFTGENIDLSGEYADAVYAAGGKISATLNATDDVYLAGGQVYLNSVDIEDLVIAGGEVRVNNSLIRDDIIVAAGEFVLDSRSKIDGSATLAGGVVTLAGIVDGDLQVYANVLKVESTAIINGDLNHSAKQVIIDNGAQIYGSNNQLAMSGTSPVRNFFWAIGIFFIATGLLIAPVISTLIQPIPERARQRIRFSFFENLGRGTLIALLAPVLMLTLLISVLGIPLLIVLVPFLFIGLLVSWTLGVYALADLISSMGGESKFQIYSRRRKFAWVFFAAAVASILSLVPIFGFAFSIVLLVTGVGAAEAEVSSHFGLKRITSTSKPAEEENQTVREQPTPV